MNKSGFKRFVLFFVVLAGFFRLGAQTDSAKKITDSLRRISPCMAVMAGDSGLSLLHLPDSGLASWYGKKFEGRLTTSGERFHADSMTCAHKTLPFGTLLKVTNLKNDSVVVVKVTDRLPKSSKRMIDLSSGAAKRLGFLRAGLTQVRLEFAGCGPIRKGRKKA